MLEQLLHSEYTQYILQELAFFIRTPLFWQALLAIALIIGLIIATISLIKMLCSSIINGIKNLIHERRYHYYD